MRRSLVLALVLVAAACGDDDDAAAPTTTAGPTTTEAPVETTAPPATDAPTTATTAPPGTVPLSELALALTPIAELDAPVGIVARPGSGELWVAEQGGRVVVLPPDGGDPVTAVDISDDTEAQGERGLLGIAFEAGGDTLLLSYTDNEGDSHVDRFAVSAAGEVDAGSRTELLFVEQPFPNHNGGHLLLGPDDAVWLGLGDGGSGGDPDGHAQRDGDPLGKLHRLAPGADAFEIVAKGVRNPWRFSFDRETDDLWLGDVGQDSYEEINRVPFDLVVGSDFAWDRREGNHDFDGSAEPDDIVPVFEYGREGGACSVTGGFVYRGEAIPTLVGTYLFGDFCEGVVRALRVGDDGRAVVGSLGLEVGSISSFGEDLAGELYVLSLDGTVFRVDPAS